MDDYKHYKAFNLAIDLYYENFQSFQKVYKSDKRLTLQEKKVLSGLILFKKGNLSELEELLLHFKSSFSSVFLEGYLELLVGVYYNNIGSYVKSIDTLTSSLRKLESTNAEPYLFNVLKNLCYSCFNSKDKKKFETAYKKLIKIDLEGCIQKEFDRERVKACYYMLSNKPDDAFLTLDKLINSDNKQLKERKYNVLIQKIEFHISKEEFKDALSSLETLKNFRSFSVKAYFNFYSQLLNHLLSSTPLYTYKNQFTGHEKYYHQVLFIKYLTQKDFVSAKEKWLFLKSNWPNFFHEDFSYNRVDIFFFCYQKYKGEFSNSNSIVKEELSEIQSQQGKIEYLLLNNERISRDEIISLIWDDDQVDHNNKLNIFITRLRSKYKIKLKNSCYYIDKSSA